MKGKRLNRAGGRYQWEGQGHKENVKESKYGEYILYSCVKIEQ
jgi:hypothetical protein